MHYQCPNCDKKAETIETLRKLGCDCKSTPLLMLDHDDKTKPTKEKEKDERGASKKALDFALTKIKQLVISENNSDDVYAVIEVKNHVEAINFSSSRAIHWLNYEYSTNIDSNEIHSEDFFKTVLNHIRAKAQMNGTKTVPIHNRVAHLDNAIYYDLGTSDWQLIKITPDGIDLVKFDVSCPIFRRSQSLQRQVMPEKGDGKALDKLAELLRILPKDRLVFKVHLVALFLEAYPIPMMVFDGMAGSIKTTATATVKQIVDPNGTKKEDNVSAMAEKQDDLILQLQNRYLPSFDNVSSISPKVSDILCRAITGSNNPRRKLYTDDEESIHSFKRKIVLNGIVPYLDYPDLQTRLINYAREMIDETNRMTEQEFRRKFDELLPFVLGQIFIILCKALRTYPILKDQFKPKTRMSDFEVWGEIISRSLGYQEGKFLDMYYEKLNESNLSSQDSYPIVSAIQSFMKERESWENTVTTLYQHLVIIVQDQGVDIQSRHVRFPKSPNKLTRELVIVNPLLRNSGFIIEKYHYTKNDGKFTKNTTIVKITRRSNLEFSTFSGISSPSSLSPPTFDLDTKNGENTGDDTRTQNKVHSPEKSETICENKTSKYGEDGEHNKEKTSNVKQFVCKTCDAGPFYENDDGSQGIKIKDYHEKQGHKIDFIDEMEN